MAFIDLFHRFLSPLRRRASGTATLRPAEALAESERRFAAFMNNTSIVGWMKDAEFRYDYVNEPYHLLLGIPADRVIGRDDFAIFPEATARELRNNDETVLRTGRPLETHETVPNRDGQLRDWWVYKFPFQDSTGRRFVGGVAFDITDRVTTERALQEQEREQRRLHLEWERLVENLHDGVIQDIYAIGLSLVETLRLVPQNPGAARHRIAEAIADLNLVIGELRANLSGAPPQAITGERMADALCHYISIWEGNQAMQFAMDLDTEAVTALTPEQALHVLYIARELVSNSVRHSQGRQGFVSLKLDQEGVRLAVEDNGMGFCPDAAKAGTGLGLRTLHARARTLGARVEIDSRPGRGARIVVYIPSQPSL